MWKVYGICKFKDAEEKQVSLVKNKKEAEKKINTILYR
jgi:hypothetical protein